MVLACSGKMPHHFAITRSHQVNSGAQQNQDMTIKIDEYKLANTKILIAKQF
jgi:hypothetical protein